MFREQIGESFAAVMVSIFIATVALPPRALALGRGGGGGPRSSVGFSSNREQGHGHGFRGHRFFAGDGFVNGGEVTIEQSLTTPVMEPSKPVNKGRYVQPRWVNGGYGVEVLQPGYWTRQQGDIER
jgi:hypothetical protein